MLFLRGIMCLLWLWTASNLAASPQTLPAPQASARAPKALSVRDAILLALRNNPDVKSDELQRVVDKFALEVAQNVFAPQYTLTGTAAYQKGSQAEYSIAPGISIATPIGTSAAVTYENAIGGELGSTNLGTTNFNITQPLLQGFGTAVNKAPLQNAEDAEWMAKLHFKHNISVVVAAVVRQYYALMADAHAMSVQQKSLGQAAEILRQFKLKLELGKIASSDVVQQEATYAATQLSLAQQGITQAQDYQFFLQLLGLDPDSQLKIQTQLGVRERSRIPSVKHSIERALKQNPQYQIALANLRILKRAVVIAQDQQRWQVDLTYNKAIGNIGSGSLVDQHPIYGVSLNVPIHDLPRQQQLVNAKIAYDQGRLALEKLRRALISSVMIELKNIHSLYQQINLAELSVSYQQKVLKATALKQRYGKASAFDLSQQQMLLLQQELNAIHQKMALMNALENLNLILGITLREWGVEYARD